MATIDELRKIRIKKLRNIEKAGLWAYPIGTKRTHTIKDALADFGNLAKDLKEVVLVGRIRSMRGHGGATFADVEDGTGKMQIFLKKDGLGEKGYQFFCDNFDIGDFIEVKGTLFETKRGEKTIDVLDFKMLAKSLRPLPEKWHGLQDVEERYRKRYLDLIFNPEVRNKFKNRSKIIAELRNFLTERGFMEVETPTLQTIYGGAKAKPFKTHLNAYDLDLYLRISPELYLKRLTIGGFEKVFEFARNFRNEGVDKQHNPDFSELEVYWAYADYRDLMKLVEEMFGQVLNAVLKTKKITYQEQELNFSAPWRRIEYRAVLQKYAGISYDDINRDSFFKEAKKLKVEVDKNADKSEIADQIYKKFCRPQIIQPTFLIHYPLGFQPLAKQVKPGAPTLANFQLVVAGFEMMNAFSELNDPIEQAARFKEQEKMFKLGFEEAQRSDKEFIEALEYGMPPAAGLGIGVDRLVALLTDSNALREAILFPIMKPKN